MNKGWFITGAARGMGKAIADAALQAGDADMPPLHLPIGGDAPAVLEAYAEQLQSDTDSWRKKATDTSC